MLWVQHSREKQDICSLGVKHRLELPMPHSKPMAMNTTLRYKWRTELKTLAKTMHNQ